MRTIEANQTGADDIGLHFPQACVVQQIERRRVKTLMTSGLIGQRQPRIKHLAQCGHGQSVVIERTDLFDVVHAQIQFFDHALDRGTPQQ
ncbi:hypothetical protein D3C71_1681930 [compost metagenome]